MMNDHTRKTYFWSLFLLPALLVGWMQLQEEKQVPTTAATLLTEGCAGLDATLELCTYCPEVAVGVDLFAALNGNPMAGGSWTDRSGTGLELDDPSAVDFRGIPDGRYSFAYVLDDVSACPQGDEAVVTVVVENYNPGCEDTIQVTLDGECSFTILPDNLLAGESDCSAMYRVSLFDELDRPLANPIGAELAGRTITGLAFIPDCGVEYSCTTQIKVRDFDVPAIDTIIRRDDELRIICHDIDNILNDPRTWQDSTYKYWIGAPYFSDNCGALSVTATDEIIYGECDTAFAKLFRTFRAQDARGNVLDTTLCFAFNYPRFSPISKLEDVYINSCLPDGEAIPATYPYIINAFGDTLFLTENGCDYSIGFEDREFDYCGGARKINRIVKLFNWCDDTARNIDTLNIFIGDFAGPELLNVPDDTVTISTIPNDCQAAFRVDPNDLNVLFDLEIEDCVGGVSLSGSILTYQKLDPFLHPGGGMGFLPTKYPVNYGGWISQIPLGKHALVINAVDGCENTSTDTIYFKVEDLSAPSVKCNDKIHVGLTVEEYAKIFAFDIDEGSWDNCGLTDLRIRRFVPEDCRARYDYDEDGQVLGDELTEEGYTRENDPVSRGRYVEFFCCDLDDEPEIQLLGYDANGNVGACHSTLLLDDKYPPSCRAPQGRIVSCQSPDLSDLSNFGTAELASDYCGNANLTELAAVRDIGGCGLGKITRAWQAVKYEGTERELRSDTCFQTITITPVNNYEICFPKDTLVNCGIAPNPDNIAYSELGCDLLAVNIQEERFDVTAAECYKLARTYEVINWCEYDGIAPPVVVSRDMDGDGVPGDEQICVMVRPSHITYLDRDTDEYSVVPNKKGFWTNSRENAAWRSTGFWQYTQIIKVKDDIAPVIIADEPEAFCSTINASPDACSAEVEVTFSVMEECTSFLEVEVFVALFNGEEVDITNESLFGSGQNYVVRGSFPLGEHTLVLKANDGCGNRSSSRVPFQVIDCLGPTPICKQKLTTSLEPLQGSGNNEAFKTIWATEYLASPVFDCTGTGPKGLVEIYSINRRGTSPSKEQQAILLDCDDLGTIVELEIHGWDGLGNSGFCVTQIEVRDNNNYCAPVDVLEGMISGVVQTEDGRMVEGVEVMLSGAEQMMYMTNESGNYSFPNLVKGEAYEIAPHRKDDYTNGVTTFDLIKIQKHILGISKLRTPYQLLAADVNQSGSVTTLDLIHLRKLVLGITDELPGVASWRFIDAEFVFQQPDQPWRDVIPEDRNMALTTEVAFADFIAVKMGDVNGSAEANHVQGDTEARSGQEMEILVPDLELRVGEKYEVPFRITEIDLVQGFQFELQYDKSVLDIQKVEYGLAQSSNIALFHQEGRIGSSWNRVGDAQEDPRIYTLHFTARGSGMLSDYLSLEEGEMKEEGYTRFDEIMKVRMAFFRPEPSEAIVLEQNHPNPFSEDTQINFFINETQTIHFYVYDITGHLILEQHLPETAAGWHQIQLSARAFPETGIYFYQLQADTFKETKRLLVQ